MNKPVLPECVVEWWNRRVHVPEKDLDVPVNSIDELCKSWQTQVDTYIKAAKRNAQFSQERTYNLNAASRVTEAFIADVRQWHHERRYQIIYAAEAKGEK